MKYTSDCDVYLSVTDAAFNRVLSIVAAQRPSLFNYATDWFAKRPDLFCKPIPRPSNGAPLVTIIPAKPLPSPANIQISQELLLQITDVAMGFSPGTFPLPPKLGALPNQRFAIKAKAVARLGLPPDIPPFIPCPDSSTPSTFVTVATPCLDLEFFLVGDSTFQACTKASYFTLRCDALAVTGLSPASLQQICESFLFALLNYSVLPGMWSKLGPQVMDLSSSTPTSSTSGKITLTFQPSSVTPNPDISANSIKLRLAAQVS